MEVQQNCILLSTDIQVYSSSYPPANLAEYRPNQKKIRRWNERAPSTEKLTKMS